MFGNTRYAGFRPRFTLEQNLKESLGLEGCPVIRNAADISSLFDEVGRLSREVMVSGAVDSKCRVLHCSLLAVGTTDHLLLRVGDAFYGAIQTGASAIILAHNHPSGSLQPSRADLDLTESVAEAGLMLGFPLLDHVILAPHGYRSLLNVDLLKAAQRRTHAAQGAVKAAADGELRPLEWTCSHCGGENTVPLHMTLLSNVSEDACKPARCSGCGQFTWLTHSK
ncbi:MAG TPA: JAB domain-containing protein [Planctomycetota bacterium]|nr:JAB domain-containing protein [Planctomycetota bacterium]